MLTIYKFFLRPHLDCGDVIYDRAFNEFFQNMLEYVQYNVALAITRAIRDSLREKLYQELGRQNHRDDNENCACFSNLKK